MTSPPLISPPPAKQAKHTPTKASSSLVTTVTTPAKKRYSEGTR